MRHVPARASARKAEERPRSATPVPSIPTPPASGPRAVASGRPDQELRAVAPVRREALGAASLPELLLHGLVGGACDDPANAILRGIRADVDALGALASVAPHAPDLALAEHFAGVLEGVSSRLDVVIEVMERRQRASGGAS
jgi:hypothetical protein